MMLLANKHYIVWPVVKSYSLCEFATSIKRSVCLQVTTLVFFFTDIGVMFRREHKNCVKLDQSALILIQKNCSKGSNCRMAFGTIKRKQKTSVGFAPVFFESLRSFLPWSLKIPANDGYHESFSLDCCFL